MNVQVCIVLFALMLTSCGGVHIVEPIGVVTKSVEQKAPVLLSQEEKARLYDISFPISVEPYKIIFSEDSSIVGYCTSDPLEKLVQYHTADMEYWGWEKHMSCIGDESCITFKKPMKECVITFRKEMGITRTVLFIGRSR